MDPTKLSQKQIMNRIFKDISGFEIPSIDEKRVKNSKGSPVYGEINYQSLNHLLQHLKPTSKDIFVDLGSGVGKVVIHSAMVTNIKKAIGIELSRMRYVDAQKALKRASLWAPAIVKRCSFVHGDLMEQDLSKATIVYTCSTAFSQNFMKRVTKRLATFKQNFRLISLQDLPNEKYFDLEETIRLDMSWARKIPVYIYRRNRKPAC